MSKSMSCHKWKGTPMREDSDFRTCPDCGQSHRWRLGRELSDAIDAYAAGDITAEQVVRASVDQDFSDITRDA